MRRGSGDIQLIHWASLVLIGFLVRNFQLPIIMQKTQSVVATLESLGYFSTMTQHFFGARERAKLLTVIFLKQAESPVLENRVGKHFKVCIAWAFRACAIETELPINISYSIWASHITINFIHSTGKDSVVYTLLPAPLFLMCSCS